MAAPGGTIQADEINHATMSMFGYKQAGVIHPAALYNDRGNFFQQNQQMTDILDWIRYTHSPRKDLLYGADGMDSAPFATLINPGDRAIACRISAPEFMPKILMFMVSHDDTNFTLSMDAGIDTSNFVSKINTWFTVNGVGTTDRTYVLAGIICHKAEDPAQPIDIHNCHFCSYVLTDCYDDSMTYTKYDNDVAHWGINTTISTSFPGQLEFVVNDKIIPNTLVYVRLDDKDHAKVPPNDWLT